MHIVKISVCVALLTISAILPAQTFVPTVGRTLWSVGRKVEERERGQETTCEAATDGNSWVKTVADRSRRGKLHDAFQNVRGDSGKWNDSPILQHAPPLRRKPENVSIDEWADQLLKQDIKHASDDDHWILLRTRQLDDNDRIWVDRIERKGNQFTVVVNEAIWQGRYSKTFTYYGVFGVNLGKVEPGDYEVTWIIQPLEFKQFDGDGRPMANWPKDERPTETKPSELRLKFSTSRK